MLHVQTEGSSHPEHFESVNGITPAMRNARKRHFNNVDIHPDDVLSVEDDLLQLVQVRPEQFRMCTACCRFSCMSTLANMQLCQFRQQCIMPLFQNLATMNGLPCIYLLTFTLPSMPAPTTRSNVSIAYYLHVLQGRAPQNTIIEDVEEEFKVDEHGNGSWQPVEKKAAPKVLLSVKGEPGTKPKRKKAVKKTQADVEQL